MARPKSPKHHRRTRRVIFWLTEAEYLRLAHMASALNLKVNAFARMLVLRSGRSGKTEHGSDQDKTRQSNHRAEPQDPALIRQLYFIGHNLNQLVKNTHIFGRVSPHVERLCLRIEALMDRALGEESQNQSLGDRNEDDR